MIKIGKLTIAAVVVGTALTLSGAAKAATVPLAPSYTGITVPADISDPLTKVGYRHGGFHGGFHRGFRGGFRNRGFRRGGFRNRGFRRGGFRRRGFRNGGFRRDFRGGFRNRRFRGARGAGR